MPLNSLEKIEFKFGLKAMILRAKVRLSTSRIVLPSNLPLLSMSLKPGLMG